MSSSVEARVTVPDVTGEEVGRASSRLLDAGFDPVRTSVRFAADGSGTVSGTFPPAGAVLGPGAEVELLGSTSDVEGPRAQDDEGDPDEWKVPSEMVGEHMLDLQDVLIQRKIKYRFHAQTCADDGRVTRIEPPTGYSSFVDFWFCIPPFEPTDPPEPI